MPYQPDFPRLLTPGSRYLHDDVCYVIEPHRLDDLILPTGQVVACDPLVCAPFPQDAVPFSVTVPPGVYRQVAWVAVLSKQDTEWQRRNAALQLVIRDAPAVRWEPALCPNQDPATLGDDEFFGYGVDAGCGTLCDLAAIQALATWDDDDVDDVLIPAMIPGAPVPGLVAAVADPVTGVNLTVVGSGWGDGVYPTFIGYTTDGEVACFVTDFRVVPR